MNRLKFLYLWSLGTGAMDAFTGLLLIFVPETVLRLLFISPPAADAFVYLSWMGVFIAAVGLSYGVVLVGNREAVTVWWITTTVRFFVAAFLVWKILAGELAPAWGIVALSDGLIAVFQFVLLRLGWWKGTAA